MQPSRIPPIITLITDFGFVDHYVGTMKGVLLSRCPDARLIDISHEIPAFSIHAGAYAIDQAAPYFPPGTVHVVVVDPGVGTERKAILVEALEQYFIAPDNGVLSLILARDQNAKGYEITNRDLWLPSPSSTFHGRDVFAPVAAALACGAARPRNVGSFASQIVRLAGFSAQQSESGLWRGAVLSIDRFGNIITNFKASELPILESSEFALRVKDREITAFRKTFGDAPAGLCFAYFGSSGYLEIGANQRNAAADLGIKVGEAVTLRVTIG